MLHLAHKISGAAVRGTDGDIGTIEDFYFEEDRWTVRYLLVDTGKWFSGKRVLISPMSVAGEWGKTGVPLNLSKDQVWNSPEFKDGDQLSPANETQILAYYGYPDYWGSASLWGNFDSPTALVAGVPTGTAVWSTRSRGSIRRSATFAASRRARAITCTRATERSATWTTS